MITYDPLKAAVTRLTTGINSQDKDPTKVLNDFTRVFKAFTKLVNSISKITGGFGQETFDKAREQLILIHKQLLIQQGKTLRESIAISNDPELTVKATRAVDLLLSILNKEFDYSKRLPNPELHAMQTRALLLVDYGIQMGICGPTRKQELIDMFFSAKQAAEKTREAALDRSEKAVGYAIDSLSGQFSLFPSMSLSVGKDKTQPPFGRQTTKGPSAVTVNTKFSNNDINIAEVLLKIIDFVKLIKKYLKVAMGIKKSADAAKESVEAVQNITIKLSFEPPKPPEDVLDSYQRAMAAKQVKAIVGSAADALTSAASQTKGLITHMTGFIGGEAKAAILKSPVRLLKY
jgi:hypothetical protein